MRVIRLETVDSTMLECRRRLVAGEALPFIVVAAQQTGGIGRLSRRWASPPGGLWFTLAAAAPPTADPSLSVRVAVSVWGACAETLCAGWPDERPESIYRSSLRIKWPNDLVDGSDVSARKIAGILIERLGGPERPTLLCGVGINVNNEPASLPADVAGRATSLSTARNRPFTPSDIDTLLDRLTATLHGALSREHTVDEDELTNKIYFEHMWRPEEEVPITLPDGTRVRGTILDITGDGSLMARIDGFEREVRSVDRLG